MSVLKEFELNGDKYRVTDNLNGRYTYFYVEQREGNKWIRVFEQMMSGNLDNRWREIMQFIRVRADVSNNIDNFIEQIKKGEK